MIVSRRVAWIPLAILLLPTGAAALEPANDGERLMAEFGLREAAEPVSKLPGWRVPKKIVVDSDEPGHYEAEGDTSSGRASDASSNDSRHFDREPRVAQTWIDRFEELRDPVTARAGRINRIYQFTCVRIERYL